MNPKITLMEFLKISRDVTNNFIKAEGEWTKSVQWTKIQEEEMEFRDVYSPANELEEFWDNFFSKLTLLHLEKVDDESILDSAISTWNKIHERSQKTVQTKCISHE